jgi:hypothetical protein
MKDLARILAMKARELNEGMKKRVNRDPDFADFEAALTPILEAYWGRDKLDFLLLEESLKTVLELQSLSAIGRELVTDALKKVQKLKPKTKEPKNESAIEY